MTPIAGFHHLSLTVTDLAASVAWYSDVFGLDRMMDEDHEGGRAVVLVGAGGLFIGLHAHDANDSQPFAEHRTGLDHIAFAVAARNELVSWREGLVERGVRCAAIADRPWGSVLVFRDPDNIQLELCSPPAS